MTIRFHLRDVEDVNAQGRLLMQRAPGGVVTSGES
jgi:hypothetical protein